MLTVALDENGSCGRSVTGRVVRRAPAARRLRIAFDGLVGDAALARRLEERLSSLPGVVEVHADDRSGRVLVHCATEVDLDRIGAVEVPPPGRRAPAAAPAGGGLRSALGQAAARARG